MFEEAKNDLMYEKNEYDIIGGFLSPVNDGYGKPSLIEGHHRLQMCTYGIESSNWISVASWEAQQTQWTPTVQVLDHYAKILQEVSFLKNSNLQVKLLCGSDVVKSFLYHNIWAQEELEILLSKYGVVCLERSPVEMLLTEPPDRRQQSLTPKISSERSSSPLTLRTPGPHETSVSMDHKDLSIEIIVDHHPFLNRFKDMIKVVYPQIHDTTSATIVRKLLVKGHSVKYLIPNSVLDYILENQLYQSLSSISQPMPRSHL